mmetsp:Transcript_17064/g.45684  ORF Transcript_17064/g.45684 Transcript_17064/m.45684 type:complete len:132 (-) Transcript_17064:175-570(-)
MFKLRGRQFLTEFEILVLVARRGFLVELQGPVQEQEEERMRIPRNPRETGELAPRRRLGRVTESNEPAPGSAAVNSKVNANPTRWGRRKKGRPSMKLAKKTQLAAVNSGRPKVNAISNSKGMTKDGRMKKA